MNTRSAALGAIRLAGLAFLLAGAALPSRAELLTADAEAKIEDWFGAGNLAFTKVFTKIAGDGKTGADFHAAVDNRGATFVLYRVSNHYSGDSFILPDQIIGGFNPRSWTSSDGIFTTPNDIDRKAFIFNLTYDVIQRQRLGDVAGSYQTVNAVGYGPTFGDHTDINAYSSLENGLATTQSYGPITDPAAITRGSSGYWSSPGFSIFAIAQIEVYTFKAAPVVIASPQGRSVLVGGTMQLETTVQGAGLTARSFQWFRNGRTAGNTAKNKRVIHAFPTKTTCTLEFSDIGPEEAGIYDCIVTNEAGQTLSQPAILGVLPLPGLRTAGAVETRTDWQDIARPDGTIYDQFLLAGTAGTFTADSGQIARMSYLDTNESIVQVELSGSGAATVVLDVPSGPMDPVLYNQSDVRYTKGNATIILAGADETTHITIYAVGTLTNPGITLADAPYAGWAAVAATGIISTDGKLGGIHHGNVAYNATRGLTGIYAPSVSTVPEFVVHGVAASGSAQPYLYLDPNGSVSVTIAGSSLAQPNGDGISVAGLAHVTMGAGQDSCGRESPAKTIATRLFDPSGADVTDTIVTVP